MKVLLLADPNSVHTQKWAKSLSERGIQIFIFGLSKYDPNIYKAYPNIEIYSVLFTVKEIRHDQDTKKIKYLKALPELRRIIKQFNPDIVHAHFATSYGLLGALSGFHPFILSVWGSDVFDFPNRSILHKSLLMFNLYKADKILSTSHVMAKETSRYTTKEIEVTPFGIDLNIFRPFQVERPFGKNTVIIGTIKSLEENYGIQYLIHAFKIAKERSSRVSMKLFIVGGGSQETFLKNLVRELSLTEDTHFVGKVDFNEVPKYHNMLDITVFPSLSESFGVAVIEAGACEKPVIVSNVGGLPEVVEDGVTGIIVEPKNSLEIAEAIERLINDKKLSKSMGKNGRNRVMELYQWEKNVEQMLRIYKDMYLMF